MAIELEDYLTENEIIEGLRRHSFSKYLPWETYDPETKIYTNQDDTWGFLVECVPLVFAPEKTYQILNGLFRLPVLNGSVLQFILYADSYIEPYLELYEKCKTRTIPIVQKTTKAYQEFLRKGSKEGLSVTQGIPVRNFRLFVSLKMPFEKEKTPSDSYVKEIRESFFECLKGAGLSPVFMEPEDLLETYRRLLNTSPMFNYRGYDPNVLIRSQVILSETEVKKSFSDIRFGERIFKCITPKAFPKEITPLMMNFINGGVWGVASDADQIKSPFMLAVNILFEDLRFMIHRKCSLILKQQAAGSFAPSLMRKKEEFLWATDELERGTKFLRVVPILWVMSENESQLYEVVTRAKRMWEAEGFVVQEDRGILPILFIMSLPFGFYNKDKNVEFLDRDFIAPDHTLAITIPCQGDYMGTGKPVLLFVGRKGQIAGIDIFDKRANNYNLYVAASSGSGKSFFVNYLAYNYYSAGAYIRIIDIGGSYKKMTKLFGAKYIDFTEKSDIVINPFTNVREPDYELPVISSIVAQMIFSYEDRLPNQLEMSLIKDAVKWAYENEGENACIDDVFRYLKEYPTYSDLNTNNLSGASGEIQALAHKLAFNLKDWISDGLYGRWFNGKATFDISRDDFVVLELEHLKPRKELFKVVTLQIINAVTGDLYTSDRQTPRLIIFDEAWQFLKEGALLKSVIEEGYRRARKYNGSFTVITQSILDLKQFGDVGDVIRASSQWKFYLESPDFDRVLSEKLIDYGEFEMKLLKTVKSNKPKYSEIWVDGPYGVGIVRLIVDPVSYFIYTSDPKEIAEIEQLIDSGYTTEEAIDEMVRRYRS